MATYREKVRNLYSNRENRRTTIGKLANHLSNAMEHTYTEYDWNGSNISKVDVYGNNTIVYNYIYTTATDNKSYSHETTFVYHIDESEIQSYIKDEYIVREYMVFKVTNFGGSTRRHEIAWLLSHVLMTCCGLFLSGINLPIQDNIKFTNSWIDNHFLDLYQSKDVKQINQVISQTDKIISCFMFDKSQNAGIVYNIKPSVYPNIDQHIEYSNMMSVLRDICGVPEKSYSPELLIDAVVDNKIIQCFKYEVKSGDHIVDIANMFKITANDILKVNPGIGNIKEGDIIFIPKLESNQSFWLREVSDSTYKSEPSPTRQLLY